MEREKPGIFERSFFMEAEYESIKALANGLVSRNDLSQVLNINGKETCYLSTTLAWDLSRKKNYEDINYFSRTPIAEFRRAQSGFFGWASKQLDSKIKSQQKITERFSKEKEEIINKEPSIVPIVFSIDRVSNLLSSIYLQEKEEGKIKFSEFFDNSEEIIKKFREEISISRNQ